ncbi:restriction endonuclease subunit S [Flavisolibacter ginsenosidimutans]|uniref:Restriction endonuclease subunit S n=1 Tax=Flavisolibacter ginsenosidimutans TaxID=661481 RepID=A0A5B8UFS4_9BACT|nr:restriction endonuclease subunit S [Flavisolibacter ginsenosidimutans]QEC55338.1 restriction endonuclease subunit S [Flavisolibacter ginsenosidimutans]
MMKGWEVEILEKIVDVKGGKRLPKGERLLDNPTPFPYIRVTDFENYTVNTSDIKYLSPRIQEKIKNYIIKKEDVFISIAGTIGFVGKIPDVLDGANLTENAARLIVKDKNLLDRDFLVFFLSASHNKEDLLSRMSKNAQPKLSLSNIKSFQLLLPPLPEQRKIAYVLSTVQKAIEQQDKLIRTTTELKKALMQKLFTEGTKGERQKQTEIGPVPESWEVVKLGKLADVTSGGTPSRTESKYWNGGTIPWVKTGEVDYCVINEAEEHITELGLKNSSAKLYPKGTLLMAMYGQGITRGKVALLGIDATINQACAAIIPRNEQEILSEYLYYFFEFHYDFIRSLGHGANQKNLSGTLIKGIEIAYSKTIADQEFIVSTLKCFDERISIHKKKKQTLTDLFKTLLHELMTGQRRVHDLEFENLAKEYTLSDEPLTMAAEA